MQAARWVSRGKHETAEGPLQKQATMSIRVKQGVAIQNGRNARKSLLCMAQRPLGRFDEGVKAPPSCACNHLKVCLTSNAAGTTTARCDRTRPQPQAMRHGPRVPS